MIKLLVFDFDGTIADSKKLYIDAIFGFTKKYGYKLTKRHVERSLGPKLDLSLHNAGIRRYAEKIGCEINKYLIKEAPKLKLCPYVKETLRRIKERRILKTVLLTNSTRPFINVFLKKNNLRNYFGKILGAEDFLVKEEAFEKLFRKFKIKPQETVYIADKTKDVDIARKVGCKIIIVLSCSWDRKKFKKRKMKKFYIINSMKDLINYLEK